jgi:hypothetical protein
MEATVRHPEIALASSPGGQAPNLLEDGAVGPVTARSGTPLPLLTSGFSATGSHEYVLLQSVFRMEVSKREKERSFVCPGRGTGVPRS